MAPLQTPSLQTYCKDIKQLFCYGEIAFSHEVSQLSQLFPNISTLHIKADSVTTELEGGELDMRDILLRDLTFLNQYCNFQKLETVCLHSTQWYSDSSIINLIIAYDTRLAAISSRIPNLRCNFRHDKVHFAVKHARYNREIQTKKNFQENIGKISWFSSIEEISPIPSPLGSKITANKQQHVLFISSKEVLLPKLKSDG